MTEFPPPLPIDDPVLIFGVAMVAFLVAPLILQRYKLPGIVGIILVGVGLGPDGAGVLELDATFDLLGTIGLVYLMFVAGLEINLHRFIEYKDRSIVFGLLSFVIPQAAGTIVGMYVLDLSLPAALLFASIFASHTLLAYPVINRLGIAKDESVTATIGGTIITDTLALLVLAIVIAAQVEEGGIGLDFWLQLVVGLALFFAAVWFIVPRIGSWFFRNVNEESYFDFLFVMVVLFVSAYLAELAQVEHIIGAFLAGLTLNRLIPESGPLMNRIEFVGNALFIPFFLLWVGMHVDVAAITEGTETIVIAITLIVLVLVTKLAASLLTARVYDFSTDQAVTMFGLSVGQAAAALAIVLIGFDAGLFDENMLNAVILMMLVVSVISPAVVDRYGRQMVRAAREQAYDPSDAPRRVMVPFSPSSRNVEDLLDLALIVREEGSPEPLYTLSVASPGVDTEAEIAELEEALEGTKAYSAGAEVPVVTQTRVDQNVSSGIVRAVVENRITTLLIGWDGARSRRQRIFGHVIDQVLSRTGQLVLVSHLREPINTTTEVLVILPPGIDHNAGFLEAVHTIEHIAEQTGAAIRALAVSRNPDRYDTLFGMVEPEVPATFERVDGWKALLAYLRDETTDDQLVVAVSARRGTMGWQRELQTIPKSISTLTDGNFIIVYPASGDRADDRQFLQFK